MDHANWRSTTEVSSELGITPVALRAMIDSLPEGSYKVQGRGFVFSPEAEEFIKGTLKIEAEPVEPPVGPEFVIIRARFINTRMVKVQRRDKSFAIMRCRNSKLLTINRFVAAIFVEEVAGTARMAHLTQARVPSPGSILKEWGWN